MGVLVWGYALAWALVNDRVKLLTYWVLDSGKGEAEPDRPKPSRSQTQG